VLKREAGGVAESCLPAGRGLMRRSFMFYVYILKSEKDGSLYIGKTNSVERRLAEHNYGHTPSIRAKRPYSLLESTTCASEKEARQMEKEYKKGYKREEIKRKYGLM